MLTIFDLGLNPPRENSQELENVHSGINHLAKYAQDNRTGVPLTPEKITQLYEDLKPQKITATETLLPGDLVNLFFDENQILAARKASSTQEELYCNGIALRVATAGSLAIISVGSAYLPGVFPEGSIWLGAVFGKHSYKIKDMPSAKITQCLGFSDSTGLYFNFNSPVKVFQDLT